MMFLFLPFLFSLASPAWDLIESWECGADSYEWSKKFAIEWTGGCHWAVRNHANLCCKVHDHCYDYHRQTKVTQDECDLKFCDCLQEASDVNKEDCNGRLDYLCMVVKKMRNVFPGAEPPARSPVFDVWKDHRPLNLDMKSLMNVCPNNQKIVVHCHNTVVRCMEDDHEMDKRALPVKSPYQDCRSTMFDCLEYVLDTSDNDKCTSIANDLREQVLQSYQKIPNEDGNAINIAYPIAASRFLERCPAFADVIHGCFKSFNTCSAEKSAASQDRTIYAARKIDIACHQQLLNCLFAPLVRDTFPDFIMQPPPCIQSLLLFLNRIRKNELYVQDEPRAVTYIMQLPRAVWDFLFPGR